MQKATISNLQYSQSRIARLNEKFFEAKIAISHSRIEIQKRLLVEIQNRKRLKCGIHTGPLQDDPSLGDTKIRP